ncbi:MAG: hypothetical protein A2312_03855 [Candidatus Staskawiczbacteria bacterium RIFOXYB2_FULL_32_9]|uniref:Nudix hydrolase domain-containing protein n=1 Tax=Candidatus Staskawiczbacteria bacterium RIFOXYD1_FULL_32_13 TaxID=1802234 RepID=A0A1G2JQL5_9BACT|nr:MAG: hypothetical protein UR22_C0008G0024 [Parcubacteria group bacterium GW2011_GWC2_32_10]OGZ77870.1 MAG: hypothetical protein A2256_01595 [Candidatus Staskawiczbacteria bacterium RIFOXYA2_FULL_32_7]OGZ83098.1 MAG: hypothetical protein A2312_03855 [Candidatus Staskawiczbacteria bacterium RIFOXYB2_FULL_32_9]OGZ85830.1 MAG: hypothetical protein A2463_04170 [Candidatus Staskawiczbacteria bacterium RIFOXYC2_FULL_32_10]OGZ88538.1 MAG: hypothetical protein A2561_04535 [Candidatus Staskawiczbacter
MINEKHKIVPASYLVLIKDNKILLQRRFNTGYEDGKYMMVAGKVDKGESFSKCVIREASEEIGITIKSEDLKMAHLMNRITKEPKDNEWIDAFIICKKWQGNIENKEPNKCDDLKWFDVSNLPENIILYIKTALENIKNNIIYSEFGW